MPVTLGEDDHHTFSTENEPLPEEMIEQFIVPLDGAPADEFTEFVPCFSIAGTQGFAAVVYWKAGLLNYEYVLATFTLKGEVINHKVIAKTEVEGQKITRSVATIDDEWVIFVAEGKSSAEVDDFDPTTSKTFNFEILQNGEIITYNAALN